jgi:hypothetical protein
MQESQPALNIITNRPVKYVFICRIFVCIFGWAQLRTRDMLGLTTFSSFYWQVVCLFANLWFGYASVTDVGYNDVA